MKFYIALLSFLFFFSLNARVYDCFMFNHELDLLEIRLHEMYDYVDHFVLVECTQTHRRGTKPLYYDMNKDRFHQFKDKIIHVIVTNHLSTKDLWAIENYQRNQIMRGLRGASPNDIVIISDLDEIIRGRDLPKIINYLEAKKYAYVGCQLDLFVNYLNGFVGQWNGPVLTKMRNISKKSPQFLRNIRNDVFIVKNAGWHFSSVGGLQVSLIKHASNVHGAEYPNTTEHTIQASMNATACIPVDSLFPQYIIDHLETYIQKGMIKEDCRITRLEMENRIHR